MSLPISSNEPITEKIKCYIRCKPQNISTNDLPLSDSSKFISISEDKTRITIKPISNKPITDNVFILDHIFPEDTTQEKIFTEIGLKNIEYIFNGYNCTIFCYGQTGSGKTHTILGPLDELYEDKSQLHGLLPRILSFIFNNNDKIKEYIKGDNEGISDVKIALKCSCLELYQEHFIDLLSPNIKNTFSDNTSVSDDKEDNINTKSERLNIREDPKRGMYVENITEIIIDNISTAKELIITGLKNRHVAPNDINLESSRSHLIFTLFATIMYTLPSGEMITKFSRLHCIDLAGAERQYSRAPCKGARLKESGMINKSLSTLGNVINALTDKDGGKTKYVPFRDSKLTYFLKDSLGGNAKTTIIGTISQSVFHVNETLSTLKFVKRAKEIKNEIRMNEETEETVVLLRKEIMRLKNIIKNSSGHIKRQSSLFLPMGNYIIDDKNNTDNSTCVTNSSKNDIDDIKGIISKINSLIDLEDSIKEKCSSFNFIVNDTVKAFIANKEEYKAKSIEHFDEIQTYLSSLKELSKVSTEDISSMKKTLDNIANNPSKEISNDFLSKIDFIIRNLDNIQSLINVKDLSELERLRRENEQLKMEIEAYKNLSDYYIEKENSEMQIYKEDIAYMKDIIDKFIDSNTSIETFLRKNVIKGDINEDIVIVNKMSYEKNKFQLEELKLKEENYIKTIEEMQSENYLLTMELLKYQPQNIGNSNSNSSSDNNSFFLTNSPMNSDKNIIYSYKKPSLSSKNVDTLLFNRELGLKPVNHSEMELMKIKEKLDETFLNLCEANKAIEEKDEKIQNLNDQLLSVKIDKDRLDLEITDLNDQIDNLRKSNLYYESSIQKMNLYIEEIIKLLESIGKEVSVNEMKIDFFIKEYEKIFDKYKGTCYSFKEVWNEKTIIKMEFDNLIKEAKRFNNLQKTQMNLTVIHKKEWKDLIMSHIEIEIIDKRNDALCVCNVNSIEVVNNYKSFDKVIEVSNERIEFLTLSPLKRLSIINLNSFSFINHKHHILSIGNNQSLSYQAKQHIYIEDSKISFEIICNKDKRFIPYPSSRFTVYQSTHIKEEYSHLKAFIVKQFKIDSKSGIDIITALSDKLKEIEVNKVKEEKNKVLLNNLSEIKNQNKNLLNEISTLKEEYKSSLNIYQHKELSITNISLSYMKIKVKKNIRKYLITKYFFTCNSKFPNSTKDNKRFKERIKYLFGKSFTFEDFFIDEKLSKYSSKEQSLNAKVIQLKIEKQKIKNELNQLKSELNKLSFESKLNGKYSLLEQIKEENIILKADIEKLRKTNEHQKKMIENVKQMNISYYEPVKTKFRKSNSQKDLLTADYSFEQ